MEAVAMVVERSELARAASLIAQTATFLASRWGDLQPSSREEVLRSLDSATEQLELVLSRHTCRTDDALYDEALAVRVSCF